MSTRTPGRVWALRAVVALAGGAAIGFVQYRIVLAGMRAVAGTAGLAGIGVGAGYAVAVGVLTVLLLALTTALLRLRYWPVAALVAGFAELLLAALLWPLIRLPGDSAARLCIPIAAVSTVVVVLCWPHRVR